MYIVKCAFCFALCAVTHLVVVVTAYIWQGLILAVISIYVMLPIIIQNTAFLIQMVFKIKTYKYAIFEWVIYSVYDRRFLIPLNYQLDISIMDIKLNLESAIYEYIIDLHCSIYSSRGFMPVVCKSVNL